MEDKDTIALIFGLSFFALIGFLAFIYITKKEQVTPIVQYYAQPLQSTARRYVAPIQKVIKTEEIRPRHPHIVNQILHQANTWYEIKLPSEGVKAWSLRCREDHDINYCFEPSASTYMTLTAGNVLSEDTAPEGNLIHAIYVRCAEAVTVEFELWREEPSLNLFP